MLQNRKLSLPRLNENTQEIEEVETSQSIIFIGANGSGKTRLGSWIEMNSPQKVLVHRISAQKSLSMPDFSAIQSIEDAENSLLYGAP